MRKEQRNEKGHEVKEIEEDKRGGGAEGRGDEQVK